MPDERDYLASVTAKPDDVKHYGIKGMKWGVRRSKAQLKSDAEKVSDEPSGTKKPTADHLSKAPETPASRYARLAAQAKAGNGNQMSDEDLKFFNSRTEALNKINKLNQTNPGWLSQTAKKVVQTTAQNQLQTISDALGNKYISGPILDSIGKHTPKEAAKKKPASKG